MGGGGGGGGAGEGQMHYQNHAPFSVSVLSFCAYKDSYFFFLLSELRSCVKVDVDVPNKLTVFVDVKQHSTNFLLS